MGGTDAAGAWTPRDAYDAIEAGLVLALRRLGAIIRPTTRLASSALDVIAALEALLPPQSRRTLDGEQMQQFSTPPSLGWAAARTLAPTESDILVEPSAGTGLLAVMAAIAGAKLVLNELCPTRRGLLAAVLQPALAHDALYLSSLLPADLRPTLCLMNPPFSADVNRPGMRNSTIGLEHIKQALEVLVPGGRLTAIIGDNVDRLGRHSDWFAEIAATATLRADLQFDERVFQRFGTTFATRMLVFDKGPPDSASIIVGQFLTPADALSTIDKLPPRAPLHPTTSVAPTVPTQPQGMLFALPAIGRAKPAVHPAKPSQGTPFLPSNESPQALEYDVIEWREPTGDLGEGLYEPYRPARLKISGAMPHPTDLVQSAAMAAVAPPTPTYHPLLQPSLITKGRLSDAQLEVIIYVGQAHETYLPSGADPDADVSDRTPRIQDLLKQAVTTRPYRRGAMIGDGTGVGKGSENTGIILDHWNRGRRKAIWLSETKTLMQDAIRDWTWLGLDPNDIFFLGAIGATDSIKRDTGVLYATYATLRSAAKDGSKTRLEQIYEWVGPDFDGVIIIDEAHNLGGAAPTKGDIGSKEASQQGLAGLDLQRLLPDARVVYVSATGATKLENLAYAERLGIWGPRTAFANREEFITGMTEGGIAALELISQDLKAMGLYMSRALSFLGVEYERVIHALTEDQVRIYDQLADAWALVLANMQEALKASGVVDPDGKTLNSRAKAAALSQFWGANQRFWNQIITAMKMPTAIASIEADLAAGHAAVLQIANTNEAVMERALGRVSADDSLDDVDMTPREVLIDYVETSFPVQQMITYEDPDGNIRSKVATDPETGEPLQCRVALRLRENLLLQLASIKVPHGPLEMLIDHFGPDAVAEVTGRRRRVVQRERDGAMHRVAEARSASANIAEASAFQNDEKRILVFSPAGGTGRSYHADRRVKNQRPRQHYLIQSGWRSEIAVQGFGRTHRTNQVAPPRYKLCTTNLKGETRFISTIARRLDQLGALTRGQRQTGSQGIYKETDNLESKYARDAFVALCHDLAAMRVPEFPLTKFAERTGLKLTNDDGSLCKDLPPITQFLNRLLSLRVAEQDLIFSLLQDRMEALIMKAHADGTYDVGIETIRPKNLVVQERRVIFAHPESKAETVLLKLRATDPLKPLDLTKVIAEGTHYGNLHFRLNTASHRVAAICNATHRTDVTGLLVNRVRVFRPNGREIRDQHEIEGENWKIIDAAIAQELWEGEVARLPETEHWDFSVISGTMLPIWNKIPGDNVRIYRMMTDAGDRILGRLIKPHQIAKLLANLGHDNSDIMNAESILDYLTSGARVSLTNRWALRQVRLNDQQRIEVVISDADSGRRLESLRDAGFLVERINYAARVFVPMANPLPYLRKLIDISPPAEITSTRMAA